MLKSETPRKLAIMLGVLFLGMSNGNAQESSSMPSCSDAKVSKKVQYTIKHSSWGRHLNIEKTTIKEQPPKIRMQGIDYENTKMCRVTLYTSDGMVGATAFLSWADDEKTELYIQMEPQEQLRM